MKASFAILGLLLLEQFCWAQSSSRAELDKQLFGELEVVAKKCDQLNLPQLGKATRGYFVDRDPQRLYLFIPDRAETLQPKDGSPKIHQQWFSRLMRVRQRHATKLFELAKRLVETDPTTAFQLLHEVLHHDPQHEEARKVLGYKKIAGNWQPRRQRIQKVERGRFPLRKIKFARNEYWRIETAHFRISTNHSKEAGLRLAHKLEDLYAVWSQVFFAFWSNKARLKNQFAGQVRPRQPIRHQVVLFRDKADYVTRLQAIEPRIGLSVGLYMQNQRTAYFFAGDPSVESTWLHEATHQLLHESLARRRGQIGVRANFWVVEGIAMYMESLCRHNGFWTVGGFDADRLQYARYRVLNENFYMKLANLVRLNRRALQMDPNIRKLYSQSAGLAHFFMNGNDGKLRPALIRYLLAIYDKRDRQQSLALITREGLASLDGQYKRFLLVPDASLSRLNPADHVQRLSLGMCPISDTGLSHVRGYKKLSWLGLSTTKVTDTGLLKVLPTLTGLEILDLENTATSNKGLAAVAALKSLEELDVSGTRISDNGLAHLRTLSNLKILYLSNTQVSDSALTHLYGLKQLAELDLTGTRISAAAIRNLKARLPKLKVNGK